MRLKILHLFVLALVAWAAAAELKPLTGLEADGKIYLVARNDTPQIGAVEMTDTDEQVAGFPRWEGR